VQPQQLRSFPATLQQLELDCWSDQPHAAFILDAAALAACCPQLRAVFLGLQATALANIGSIAQWTALESLVLYTAPAAEPAVVQQAIAAASQLPHLHSLKLPRLQLSTSSQLWAQLASLRALRSLKLWTLHVDSAAAPSTSIRHLQAALTLQLPAEQLDGCLAALLPALQQLGGPVPTIQPVLLALHGHPSMQQLVLCANSSSTARWQQQQQVSSMPQLRQLNLWGIHVELLGALLEDASGCAQLQELQLGVGCEDAGPAAGSSWAQGLAALASGPCRHSLRSIKFDDALGGVDAQHGAATPAQLAQLLRPGALTQLRELQLGVRVHAGSLLPRRSARLQQASKAGAAAATQRPPQQELPGTPKQHLQLLVGGLQQAGVQGLGGFRLTGELSSTAFHGSVGPCRFSGRLRVVW
jgi:hypothetical protein